MAKWFNFIHNCIAHPLLFFSGDAIWAIRFHDWSNEAMKVRYPKVWKRL